MNQEINEASFVWLELMREIIAEGEDSSPRGIPTREILAKQSQVSMFDPIIEIKERKLGYKFLCAEAAWILSGDNKVSSIAPYSKQISHFSDDGVTFFGSYGPKVLDQLSYVVSCLENDNDSRQAVMNIWREKPGKTKDVPCTISLQFIIRDGKLHCIDTMRSSDAWLGWPYDIFNMSMISRAVIIMLKAKGINVKLGDLSLTAGSQHLYGTNLASAFDICDLMFDLEPQKNVCLNPERFETIEELIEHLWTAANSSAPKSILYI